MKLMVCANLGAGSLPGIDWPAERISQWEQDRVEALGAALEDARARGVDVCLMAGGLFGQGFVPQSLLAGAMNEAGCHGVPVWYVPLPAEAEDIEQRVTSASNVTVLRCDNGEATLDVQVGDETCHVAVQDASGLDSHGPEAASSQDIVVVRDGRDMALYDDGTLVARLGAVEPAAFGEPLPSGYLLLTVADGKVERSEWIERALHPFVVRRVTLDDPRDAREVLTTVGESVKGVDRAACLRVELRGRIPLDVYVNTAELAQQLERYFPYVEMADECSLDVDVEALGTDVSLLAEFVRQVSSDATLSETERTRILRCGYNALNGKELVE